MKYFGDTIPEGREDEERDDECSKRDGVAGYVQAVDHLSELQHHR